MAATHLDRIHIIVIILLFLLEITVSLRCYQCTGAAGDPDCQDSATLLNITNKNYLDEDSKGDDTWRRNKYYKDCEIENTNYTMCMIETYSTRGEFISYHRDCSDGRTFSHSPSNKYPRLDNLIPNNETTCTYAAAGNYQICIRLCEGDMCNGPVPRLEAACQGRNNVTVTDEFGRNYTCSSSGFLKHFLAPGTLTSVFGGLCGLSVYTPHILFILSAVFLFR